MGQPEAGLTVLTEALVLVDTMGVRFLEAELYRLKGELHYNHLRTIRLKQKPVLPKPLR